MKTFLNQNFMRLALVGSLIATFAGVWFDKMDGSIWQNIVIGGLIGYGSRRAFENSKAAKPKDVDYTGPNMDGK